MAAQTRKLRWLVAPAVLGVTVISLGLAFSASSAVTTSTDGRRMIDDPNATRDPGTVRDWLASYDPAEVQFLLDTADPALLPLSDEYLLSLLEFRRSCRVLAKAIEASKKGEVASASDLASEQADRLSQRMAPGSDSPTVFRELANEVGRGETSNAEAFVQMSCRHSFEPSFRDN